MELVLALRVDRVGPSPGFGAIEPDDRRVVRGAR